MSLRLYRSCSCTQYSRGGSSSRHCWASCLVRFGNHSITRCRQRSRVSAMKTAWRQRLWVVTMRKGLDAMQHATMPVVGNSKHGDSRHCQLARHQHPAIVTALQPHPARPAEMSRQLWRIPTFDDRSKGVLHTAAPWPTACIQWAGGAADAGGGCQSYPRAHAQPCLCCPHAAAPSCELLPL